MTRMGNSDMVGCLLYVMLSAVTFGLWRNSLEAGLFVFIGMLTVIAAIEAWLPEATK